MPGSILGTAVRRVEDPELLTGQGSFVANLPFEGALHLAFVRSPLAHALVRGVDTATAAAAAGVAAVFTSENLDLPVHRGLYVLNERCAQPPLATDRVRFVGEAVAVAAADTAAAAVDAAILVTVDYEPLPAVVDPEAALDPSAPRQFPELGGNLAAGAREPDGVDPLDGAELVVRARMRNQRLAVVSMEGNAIAVVPGVDGEHELTIWVSTQMPHGCRRQVSRMFGIDKSRLRVIAPHVGGAFGGKAGLIAEHTVAIGVARRLGRPVVWADTRSENLVTMPHGRAQIGYLELGLTRAGVITGARWRVVADAGAYAGFGGGLASESTRPMAAGVYRVPRIGFDVAVALTNTTPVGAFRGAGRPEATAFLERVVDMAAAELGLDPVEIRRRNFLRPAEFPVTTAVGTVYDSGDYDLPLREALWLADYDGLRTEQTRRRAAGERRALGIGISSYVEVTADGGHEFGSVHVHPDGRVTISAGTSAHGQGHATAFGMLASDRLAIPFEKITFVQSDTAAVPRGAGTGGSRSLQLGGSAVQQAAGEVVEQARKLAARMLEAAVDDVALRGDGRFGVAGVPAASVGWAELARAAEDGGEPLAAGADFHQQRATFPFGAHVSVVEVDLDTGWVQPITHVAVDDCGRVLNPLLVTGQQHGGLVQGIAQALWEEVGFDPDGNPVTTTLAGYRIPSAADLPPFHTANTETPTPLNPLGAKGIGESATVGATPAVQNAVVDAVAHLGVRHIDLPCTPERVWRAIRDTEAGTLPDPWREPPPFFGSLPVRP